MAVDHKIDHTYPKLLKIPLHNTEYDTIHITRKSVIGRLQPIEIEDIKVSNILWTKDDTDTTNSPAELPSVLPESGFHLESYNTKQSIVIQDAQIPQKAKDKYYRKMDLHMLPIKILSKYYD